MKWFSDSKLNQIHKRVIVLEENARFCQSEIETKICFGKVIKVHEQLQCTQFFKFLGQPRFCL